MSIRKNRKAFIAISISVLAVTAGILFASLMHTQSTFALPIPAGTVFDNNIQHKSPDYIMLVMINVPSVGTLVGSWKASAHAAVLLSYGVSLPEKAHFHFPNASQYPSNGSFNMSITETGIYGIWFIMSEPVPVTVTAPIEMIVNATSAIWLKGTTLIGKGSGSTQMGWANITVKGNITLVGAWKAPDGGDMLVAPLVKVGNKTIPWIMDRITLADAGTLNWTLGAGNYAVIYITNGGYIKITQTIMLVSN